MALLAMVACTPKPNPGLGAPDPAADALAILRAESLIPASIAVGDQGDVSMPSLDVPVPLNVAEDPIASASWFIGRFSALLGVEPRDLVASKSLDNDDRERSVRFAQYYLDLPVYRAHMILSLDEDSDSVTSVLGNYLPNPGETLAGLVPAEEGGRISSFTSEVDAVLSAAALYGAAVDTMGVPELTWFVPSISGVPGDPRLAWRVILDGQRPETGDMIEEVVLDAENLSELYSVRGSASSDFYGEDFEISRVDDDDDNMNLCYAFDNLEEVFDEDGILGSAFSADAFLAYRSLHDTYHRFFALGRMSWDHYYWGGSGPLYVYFRPDDIQVVVEEEQAISGIASYMGGACETLIFSPGSVTDEIMVHEFTHGITDHVDGPSGKNEPGALNEGLSDIMSASLHDDWYHGDPLGSCSSDGVGSLFRSLADPADCGDPDQYSEKKSGKPDDGFVHSNSTIVSHAAFLAARGGQHAGTGIAVPSSGMGSWKVAVIWHDALSNYTGESTKMKGLRNAVVAAARKYDRKLQTYSSHDVCVAIKAHEAVELGVGDVDCDGLDDSADSDSDNDGVPDAKDSDQDNDGISNGKDNCPRLSNPGQTDVDGDGIGDSCEADADADGVFNRRDNCPYVKNAGQKDEDLDGKGDACDDSDQDGLTDEAEIALGTNRNRKDSDNDGIRDNEEVRRQLNPLRADTDGDGLSDLVEVKSISNGGSGTDPRKRDTDGDTRGDGADNCALVPNWNQADADGDGVGDVCDNAPILVNPSQSDTDGDGIADVIDDDDDGDGKLDSADNCPAVANTWQADLDGDGVGSACDVDEVELSGDDLSGVHLYAESVGRVRIPIRPCDQYCGQRLGRGELTRVSLQFTLPRLVRIVDNFGRVMSTAPVSTSAELAFTPNPDSAVDLGSGLDSPRTQYFAEISRPPGLACEVTCQETLIVDGSAVTGPRVSIAEVPPTTAPGPVHEAGEGSGVTVPGS